MMPRRSTIWVVNPDVIGRYRRGQSILQISDAYGVKWETVHAALKRAGVEVGRQNKAGYRQWTDAEIRLLIDLRQQRKTLREIADLLGRSRVSVERQHQRMCRVQNPDGWMRRRNVQYEDIPCARPA